MASPSVTQEEISAMTPDQFSEYMDSIGAKKY
jgi:hypothetical protein